jgi:hypothetical protein
MTTVQNKHASADSSRRDTDKTSAIGFGKVLNSIHGLQQRLGDFSIEDVSRAETNANTLIHRMAILQERLIHITDLKRRLVHTAATVEQMIPEPNYDHIGPASLEKHPQLFAIVKASKLIRLHKLLKIARASAHSVSFDADAGRLDVTSPLAPAVTPPKEKKYPKPTASTQPERKKEQQGAARPSDRNATAEIIELPPPPPTAIPLGAPRNTADEPIQQATKLGVSPTEGKPEPRASQSDQIGALEQIVSTNTQQDTMFPSVSAEATFGRQTTANEISKDVHTVSQVTKQVAPTQNQETPNMPTGGASDSAPAWLNTPEFRNESESTTIDEVFDHRLLEELIQIYGEFAPVAEASKPHSVRSESRVELAEVKPEATAPQSEPAAPPLDRTAPRSENTAVHVETTLPPEPKFVTAEPMATMETATIEVGVPVKSRGDLDRQLKKIIKDYGEYDLYSHTSRSSITLKRGGIAAFVVLGLVLGGVYFLRSPEKPASQVNSARETLPSSPEPAMQDSSGIARDVGTTRDINKKLNGTERVLSPTKAKTQQKQ